MGMKAVMGVDLGTGGVKSILVAQNGRILRGTFREYPTLKNAGRIEQKTADWWPGARGAISEAVQIAAQNDLEIVGVAAAGQMHGDVLFDEKLNVLVNPTLWNSPHTGDLLNETLADSRKRQRIIELTGNDPFARAPGMKLAWRKINQSETFGQVSSFTTPGGFIARMLTEQPGITTDEAGMSLLFDYLRRTWSDELYGIFGLPMTLRPRIVEPTGTFGMVSHGGSIETNLPLAIPVAGGGGDQTCSAVGNGVIKPGRVGITLGSSGVVAAFSEKFSPDPTGLIHILPDATGHYYFMACSMSSGDSLKWWKNAILGGSLSSQEVYHLMLTEAKAVPAGADGLTFLPFLVGSNHPIKDPFAKGVFFGVSPRVVGLSHFTRAILEGVAAELAISVEKMQGFGVPVEEVLLAGGGAKDETGLWPQIFADILQRPVTLNLEPETTAVGAAITAGMCAELWPSFEEACGTVVKTGQTFEPNPANRQVYADLLGNFKALAADLKPSFERTGLPG